MTIRDYENFDKSLSSLYKDVYPQPSDKGHTAWAKLAIESMHINDVESVLDVGCGVGFCQDIFASIGVQDYLGITASYEDQMGASKSGKNVILGGMTYIPKNSNAFDLVFARHILEHSPFPIITLMEWRRVSRRNLLLIAPNPDYWGWAGKNHYSMANPEQLWWWLRRAGWMVMDEKEFKTSHPKFISTYSNNEKRLEEGKKLIEIPGAPQIVEYWYVCEKAEPITI